MASKTRHNHPAQITRTFEAERETKRMVRFAEVPNDGQPVVSGTLYVTKEALAELGDPDALIVTVTPVVSK